MSSARSGCSMFAFIGLSVLLVLAWFLYTGWQQVKSIKTFTVASAPVWPKVDVSDGDREALEKKLNPDAEEWRLTPTDLKTLFATRPELAEYTGMIRVTGLDEEHQGVVADLALPLNSLPWEAQPYLVGSCVIKPGITQARFWITLRNVTVPGKTIPEGFQRNLDSVNWADTLPKEISSILDKITEAKIEKGELILRRAAKQSTP